MIMIPLSPCSANQFSLAPLRDELLGCHLVTVEDAADVDVENARDVLLGEVKDGLDLCDACVGHHDGQRSQCFD